MFHKNFSTWGENALSGALRFSRSSLFIFLSYALINSCASMRGGLPLNDQKFVTLKSHELNLSVAGYVRVVVRSADTKFQCYETVTKSKKGSQTASSQSKVLSSVEFSLTDSKKTSVKGSAQCDPKTKTFTVRFGSIFNEGRYSLKATSTPSHLKSAEILARFYPVDPEKESGPDQLYQGATPLALGPAKGTVDPTVSDQTDWWIFKPEKPSMYEFIIEHNGIPGEVELSLFAIRNGKLASIGTLYSRKPYPVRTGTPVLARVKALPFAGKYDYSVIVAESLSSSAGPTSGGGQKVDSGVTATVLSVRKNGANETVLTLGIGSQHGVVEGERIRVYDKAKGNAELEPCVVRAMTKTESLCSIPFELSEAGHYSAVKGGL